MTLRRTMTSTSGGATKLFTARQPLTGISGGTIIDRPDRSTLSYHAIRPTSALREIITSYYQTEVVTRCERPTLSMRTLFLPSDSVRLLFTYNDSAFHFKDGETSTNGPGSVIGLHSLSSPFYTDNLPKTIKLFDVRFRPGGFCKLFGISPMEIGNACCKVEDVLGAEGRKIQDRLNNSGCMEERINILDGFFSTRLRLRRSGIYSRKLDGEIGETAAALQLIRERGGQIRVSKLAEELNVARRTMEWRFSHHTGMKAKEFARIMRLNNLLNDILHREPAGWAETAASHGYYDQMHMTKEFKSATTLTPDSFLKLKGSTFLNMVGILIFIDPARKRPDFVDDWIKASAGIEEYLRSFRQLYKKQ